VKRIQKQVPKHRLEAEVEAAKNKGAAEVATTPDHTAPCALNILSVESRIQMPVPVERVKVFV
jgi:hypothetical protein